MKEHPLVSIAIITYNQKEYLREGVESILTQDYENYEIVIADDASTDGTQEMLRDYEKKYPGKFVLKLSEKNQGITKNSNLAHFSCSGKYVAWTGGDDLMLPGKLRAQVEYMEAHSECSICYHDLEVFDSRSGKTMYLYSEKNKPRVGTIEKAIMYGTFNGACSTMLRRSSSPDYGFDLRIPISSDWLHWIETLLDGGEIHYIDKVMGRYRRHPGNITNVKVKSFKEEFLTLRIVAEKYPDLKWTAWKSMLRMTLYKYGHRLKRWMRR